MGRCGSTDIADGAQSRKQPSRSDGRRRGRTPCRRPLPETTRWAAGEVRTSPTAHRAGNNPPATTDDAEDAHHAVDRCRRRPGGPLGKCGTRRRWTEPETTLPQRRTTPRTHTMLSTAAGDDPVGRRRSAELADGGPSRKQLSRSDGRRRGRTPCCRPLSETTRWAAAEVRTSPTADRARTNPPAATDDAENAHHAVDRCRRRPDGPLRKYGHRRRRTEPEPTLPQRRTTPRTHTMPSTAAGDDPMGRCGSTDNADGGQSRNQPSRNDGRRRGHTPCRRPLPQTTRWTAAEIRTPPTADRAGTNPPAATDDAEDAHRAVDRCRRRPDGPLRKYGHRRRRTEPEPTPLPAATDDAEDAHHAVDRCPGRPDGPLRKYGHRRRRTEPEPTLPQRRTTPRTHTMLSTDVGDDPMGRCGCTDIADGGQSRNQPSRSDGRRRGRTPCCRPLPETTRWAGGEVRISPTADRAGTNPPAATDAAEDAHHAVDRCRRLPGGSAEKCGVRRRWTEPETTLPQRRLPPRRPVCGSGRLTAAAHRV